jgi:hypothetical protein
MMSKAILFAAASILSADAEPAFTGEVRLFPSGISSGRAMRATAVLSWSKRVCMCVNPG